MLTMTQVKRIKKMYYSKGKNIKDITKATGHNYRTIIKYLEKDDFNKTAPVKQRHTAKRIYERLKEEYPELLNVKYRTISSYVSQKKKEIYQDEEGFS
ncbi:MAG: hypothetical protein M0P77_08365 [Firmicutes bacterium]|nr:hypothetical protein [Bacillota bacterium]